MLAVQIAGLGVYLPERVVASRELEEQLHLTPGWIERATGVRERRRAGAETSVAMAALAGHRAIADAQLRPEQIDLVIHASASRRQLIPCTAAFVQREMGLPDGKSLCFDVDATCLSFLVALQVAAHFAAGTAHRHILIVSSETTQKTLDPAEPESSVLMGDAAVGAVVTASPPGAASCVWHAAFATHSSGVELTRCEGGGTLHHPNDPATTPAMNRFHMDGPNVYRMAARYPRPLPRCVLWPPRLGSDHGGRHRAASGQPSRRRIAHRRFGFRPEQLVLNLATRGNCVAASIPLALAEAVHAGRIRRGQQVCLMGTGAGLTLGALALTY